MRGPILLSKVQLRGFTPRTYGEDDVGKKAQVRDLLSPKITNLHGLQHMAKGKHLWIDVTFYPFKGSLVRGRAGKDIDNMAEIILDSLPEFMD